MMLHPIGFTRTNPTKMRWNSTELMKIDKIRRQFLNIGQICTFWTSMEPRCITYHTSTVEFLQSNPNCLKLIYSSDLGIGKSGDVVDV